MTNELTINRVSFLRRSKTERAVCSFFVSLPGKGMLKSGGLFGKPYNEDVVDKVCRHVSGYFAERGVESVEQSHEHGKMQIIVSEDLRVVAHFRWLFAQAGLAFSSPTNVVAPQKLADGEFPNIPRSYARLVKELNQFVAAKLNHS